MRAACRARGGPCARPAGWVRKVRWACSPKLVRLQVPPVFRASASVKFDDYGAAAQCLRALSQSGLNPSNCRLLDAMETVVSGVAMRCAVLVLVSSRTTTPCTPGWRALALVDSYGGATTPQQWRARKRGRAARTPHRHRRTARRLLAHALLA